METRLNPHRAAAERHRPQQFSQRPDAQSLRRSSVAAAAHALDRPETRGSGAAQRLHALSANTPDSRPPLSPRHSAMNKLGTLMDLLRQGSTGLSDAALQLFFYQSAQAADEASSAKGRIRSETTKMLEQNAQKIESIKQRIEAKKKSGFWGSLLKVFKVIATALSAAGSVLSGGTLGFVAAALIVASLVVSHTVKGGVGMGLTIALSVAAVALSFGSSLSNIGSAAAKGAEKSMSVLQQVKAALGDICEIGAGVAQAGAAGAGVVQSVYQHQALNAEADIAKVQAEALRSLRSKEEEQERLDEANRTLHDSLMRLMGILGDDHDVRAETLQALRAAPAY